MDYLLDTHTLIWTLEGDNRLSDKATQEIKNIDNTIFVSVVSFWEIAIKRSLGKLEFTLSFPQAYQDAVSMQINIVSIEQDHLTQVETLPFHHGDPFDRLLIAQAQVLNANILSRDGILDQYTVNVIW